MPSKMTGEQGAQSEAQILLGRVFTRAVLDSPVKGDSHLSNMARDLGTKRIVKRSLGVSGMLIPSNDGYTIAINDKDLRTQQRYSLAHEIGHLVIANASETFGIKEPKNRSQSSGYEHGNKSEERLCEEIAAELLMPAQGFRDQVQKLGQSLANVSALAAVFGTSITATAIRYWELLSEPSLIVRWRKDYSRHGAVVPAWQNRNKVKGPSAWINAPKGWQTHWKFVGAHAAFGNDGLKTTYESILTRISSGSRHHVKFPRYRVESMGFGKAENRFVLSVVYLNRSQD